MTAIPTITRVSVGDLGSVQPITAALDVKHGVWIKALATNTDPIYVGYSSIVNINTGHPIDPGDSFFVECGMTDDLNEDDIWLISSAAAQAASLHRH